MERSIVRSKINMKKCELTGVGGDRNLTTLTDGHTIAFQVYKITSNVLCKSIITMEDVIRVDSLLKQRQKLVETITILVRRGSGGLKISNDALLINIMKWENGQAIKLYNKVRGCLDVEEHMEIMLKCITEYSGLDLDTEPLSKSNRHDVLQRKYEENLSYLQRMAS